ncbi:MAG: hypothetical protein IJ744_10490 [Lachnospiraceae bacterium]|nr:hypothetical protein [Lachnospiraceae bacterium]
MADEEKNVVEVTTSDETAQTEEAPKKKKYDSQGYYIIKIISGGYVCFMAYQLISYTAQHPEKSRFWGYGIGALFAIFGIWLLYANIRGYLRYTKTNRFVDEVYGIKSEDAGLDPDAIAEVEKPVKKEPAKKMSLSEIARYRNTDEEEELQIIGAPTEDLPVIGAPKEKED